MNEQIVSYLKELETQRRIEGKSFSALAYKKATQIISSYDHEITSGKMVNNIPGIGAKIKTMIIEIIETSGLKAVDNKPKEKMEVLKLFNSIWGVGPAFATKWYEKGYRSIKELEADPDLNDKQRLGIKYYDDLKQPIQRREIQLIGEKIKLCLGILDMDFRVELCGSFRRGCKTSGDIDCLITHETKQITSDLFPEIIQDLQRRKLLLEDTFMTGKNTYMGFIQLNQRTPVRHIDIKIVSKAHWSSTLLHFTGPADFNIHMSTLAKQNGGHLNEKGLYIGSRHITMEKDIFRELNLPYLEPEERQNWRQHISQQARPNRIKPVRIRKKKNIYPTTVRVCKPENFNELIRDIDNYFANKT